MGNSSSSKAEISSLPVGMNANKPSHHDLKKFIALGAAKAGKTCLIVQHFANNFIPEYDPTVEDSYRKQNQVDGTPVIYEALDLGGGDDISLAMRDQYMRMSQGFIIVYSVCNRASFDECNEIHERILRAKDADRAPMVLVGTMSDREDREVPTGHGEELAKQLGIPFFETSAKERINVDEVFEEILRQIVRSEVVLSHAGGGGKK